MPAVTTRGRKTAASKTAVEQAEDLAPLTARVQQLVVSVSMAEDKRSAMEAELRQKLTEIQFEQRNLQSRYAKLLDSQKRQDEAHQALAQKHVANASVIETVKKNIERLMDRFGLIQSDGKVRRPARTVQDEHVDQDEHVEARSDGGSEVSFVAESRVSELDELRTEVSSFSTASTGYAHSSVEAVKKALASQRSR